jgi:hypothetical protein
MVTGTGFSWFANVEPAQHHIRYGTVTLEGAGYSLTSACFDGCCGSYTHPWDALAFVQNYAPTNGDVFPSANAPFIGWADHNCDQDGYDTSPAWKMVSGGKNDANQRFSADLVYMFR